MTYRYAAAAVLVALEFLSITGHSSLRHGSRTGRMVSVPAGIGHELDVGIWPVTLWPVWNEREQRITGYRTDQVHIIVWHSSGGVSHPLWMVSISLWPLLVVPFALATGAIAVLSIGRNTRRRV
jgi:hypothetical protein